MNQKIKEKADYCLNCKTKPCQKGCPLENDIPSFIDYIKKGEYKEAYQVLSKTSMLQPVCGRICPHESQCQGSCIRGIKGEPTTIGELEAFVADKALEEEYTFSDEKIEKKNKKVAIIGGGPAGLTCAGFLVRKGYEVSIYEKYKQLGGIIQHGIPSFRLNKKIVEKTIQKILNLGIQVYYEQELGKNLTLEQLKKNYDAIFIAIGANVSSKMGVEGENLPGVYGGNELLEYNLHPDYENKKVAIIGGGNVAMDCARTVKRLGAKEVTVIYRRAEEQMPAERKEIQEAKDEKIQFLFLHNIVRILPDNRGEKVDKIECIQTKLVRKESETRLSPVNIEGSNKIMDMDYVIMATGSKPEESVMNTLSIEKSTKGYIHVDENYQTTDPQIFAGGDIIGQKATVAWAARSGRKAAEAISEYLNKKI